MSKNQCIAAVRKYEEKTNGRAPSYDLVAAVLDELAAEKKVIAKQVTGKRSERTWYTIMVRHGLEICNVFPFEDYMATIEIELRKLRQSYQNLSKRKVAKRVAILLRTCEYQKYLAAGLSLENDNTTSKMVKKFDKLYQDITQFIHVDLWNDQELIGMIDGQYCDAKPVLHIADPEETLALWEKAEEKPLWWQLCKCGGVDYALELARSIEHEWKGKNKRKKVS
jgi:hypothetical protein